MPSAVVYITIAASPNDASQAPEAENIPKFSSFKPKPQAPSKPKEALESRSRQPRGTGEHRHREPNHQSSRHRSDRITPTWTGTPSTNTPHTKDSAADLPTARARSFTIDRSGDQKNLTYGSLHRPSVPTFARSGRGRVLGAHHFGRIDRDEGTDKYIVIKAEGSDPRWTKKKGFWFSRGGSRDELPVRPTGKASQVELDADFLALDPQKRRRTASDSSHSSDSEDETSGWQSRGRPNAANVETPVGAAAGLGTPPDPERTAESELQRRGAALSRLVDEQPGNGRTWLDLIDHQEIVQARRQSGTKLTMDERSSLAEIKLSIASKALKCVKDAPYREQLLIRVMEESVHTTIKSDLQKKWDQILEENGTMVQLWIPYVNFAQTQYIGFRLDNLRYTFTKCLQRIRRISSQSASMDSARVEVYLILRMTTCIREAGYLEQAIAIWQAILEFSFFRPSELEGEKSSRRLLESLDIFWESEAPRIGEPGAKGWSAFTLDNEDTAQEAGDARPENVEPKSFGLRTWYADEKARAAQSRRPARSLEDNGEDPYRVVLFSDIKEYILDIDHSVHHLLVDAFLLFCELPHLPSAHEYARAWYKDPFLRSFGLFEAAKTEPLGSIQEETAPEQSVEEETTRNIQPAHFGFSISSYRISPDLLFTNSNDWFSPFSFRDFEDAENRSSVQISLVRQILRILVDHGVYGDELAEFLLAVELRYFPDLVRKTAKALLKRRSSSLRLYNAYALVEYRLGNKSAADNVISAAIGMGASQSANMLLWRTSIMEAFLDQRSAEALTRLFALADKKRRLPEPPTDSAEPSQVFRAQQALIASCDQCIQSKDYESASAYIDCLMILSYLNNPEPLEAALSVFKSNVTLFPTSLPAAQHSRELLYQSFSRLLHHHVSHHSRFRPSLIRAFLSDSIEAFPENTIFLGLFAWNERRFRIDDRMRSVISKQLHPTSTSNHRSRESFVLLLFNIHVELSRAVALGSNVWSIRNAFERALGNDTAQHSPSLWKWYYDFETSRGNPQRALAVNYRSIIDCPWAKELYALLFRDSGSFENLPLYQLQDRYQSMESREFRMHIAWDKRTTEESRG